jgi:hypothetical protein
MEEPNSEMELRNVINKHLRFLGLFWQFLSIWPLSPQR